MVAWFSNLTVKWQPLEKALRRSRTQIHFTARHASWLGTAGFTSSHEWARREHDWNLFDAVDYRLCRMCRPPTGARVPVAEGNLSLLFGLGVF